MALKNISEDKFIAKPNNPNEKMKVDYVFLQIISNSKVHTQVEGVFYVTEKSKPSGVQHDEKGNEIPFEPEDILVPVGTFHIGLCETNIESPTFAMDCHKFAMEKLGEGFEIVELNNA